ncbi:MAG TPA: hypothetical protein DCZ75_15360 [Geobacter sp.]|nr:hypothetical protein [Geobacter sp.]
MKSIKLVLISALLLITAACGGGGGGSSTPPTPSTITGVAAAGIIKGGSVKAFSPYSSVTAADKKQIGTTATTLTDGTYSINLGTYTGPVIVEVSGGSYVDEATGATVVIPASAPLRAVAISASGSVDVAVTPLTDLAAKQAATLAGIGKKVTATEIDKANSQISDLFKVTDIVAVQPLDASATLVGTDAQKQYTLALAALSQYVAGGSTLTDLATSIDAGGVMTPAEATKVETALSTFIASGNNLTGVTTVPDTLQNIGTTTLTLTVALSGTGVKSVDAIINLPAGTSVAADANGAPLAGVLTKLITATNYSLEGVTSTGTLHVIFNVADQASMPAGDILTIKVDVAAGQTAPAASAFTVGDATKLKDVNGAVVSGAAITLR